MPQKIAILPEPVNRAPAGWCLLAMAATACGPLVERAPFFARYDSLSPGDLLGPFDGTVTDAESDRPVAGAVVAASWAFEKGVGFIGPGGAKEVVVESGADGRYRIPVLDTLPSGGSNRVRRFTLIVYHRGYAGWRSDNLFPGGSLRRDFSQRGNRVRLEKWQPSMPHHRHLVFLGGGAAIKAAAAWEVQPASLELDGGGAPVAGGQGVGASRGAGPRALDVGPLLSEDEVRAVTGYAGAFDVLKLADLPTTEFYDSRHWKARGKPESYDAGIRVWRLGAAGAETEYARLLAELPGAVRADEIGDASLRAKKTGVVGLAFLDRERGIVVSLTCGVDQCTEPSLILRMAKLVQSRLGDFAPAKTEGAQP